MRLVIALTIATITLIPRTALTQERGKDEDGTVKKELGLLEGK